MFGLFKKKEAGIRITEKIVISETAKLQAMSGYSETNPDSVFIFWFAESLEAAKTFFNEQQPASPTLFTAREVQAQHTAGKKVIIGEHYPLLSKEIALYEKLGLSEVTIFSSLHEPLFKLFGAEKIIQLMKQLGMKEDEVIEHALISKAIRNAQQKIESKLVVETAAHSQQDWIVKNLPAG